MPTPPPDTYASIRYLITMVRTLTGAPISLFTDDDVAGLLRDRQEKFALVRLNAVRITATNMPYSFKEYHSDDQFWEAGAIITDWNRLSVVDPSLYDEDARGGIWTFHTASSNRYHVYLTANLHDPYGAAADLLELWANRAALDVDFSADGTSQHLSQRTAALFEASSKMNAKARIRVGTRVRSDERGT